MNNSNARNHTFTILMVIGISIIVAGHLDFHVFNMWGLFPYYSFNVSIFLFVSGYFYKEADTKDIKAYVLRKALHLLFPYYIWNTFFGIIANILHSYGYGFGGKLNLYTLILAPIIDGHQFMYNFSAWFVPALFMVQLLNILYRKIINIVVYSSDNPNIMHHIELFISITYLILGLATVVLAKRGSVYDYYRLPGRLMLMLPFFQMGIIYRKYLEHIDNIPNLPYLLALTIFQRLIITNSIGTTFSMVWVASFAGSPLLPFITSITGIAFWMRISRMLEPYIGKYNTVNAIGNSTFEIMMLHTSVFMLIKKLFSLFYADFNIEAYKYLIDYVYLPGGEYYLKWLYLIPAILLPTLIKLLIDRISIAMSSIRKNK